MGSNPAPPFADNFMAKIDTKVWEIVEKLKKTNETTMECMFWFLDDLMSVYIGSTKSLHILWEEMNKIPPLVEFTLQPHVKMKNQKTDATVKLKALYHSWTHHAQ